MTCQPPIKTSTRCYGFSSAPSTIIYPGSGSAASVLKAAGFADQVQARAESRLLWPGRRPRLRFGVVGEDPHSPPACSAVETFRWNVSGHGDGPPGRLCRPRGGTVKVLPCTTWFTRRRIAGWRRVPVALPFRAAPVAAASSPSRFCRSGGVPAAEGLLSTGSAMRCRRYSSKRGVLSR
jgi:hypothetical protein